MLKVKMKILCLNVVYNMFFLINKLSYKFYEVKEKEISIDGFGVRKENYQLVFPSAISTNERNVCCSSIIS